jgi:hypothetical protein
MFFRFALVSVDGRWLGLTAFARRDFKEGDVIPSGIGRVLRVVDVVEPTHEDELPVLVVEGDDWSAPGPP